LGFLLALLDGWGCLFSKERLEEGIGWGKGFEIQILHLQNFPEIIA
jgi:hypothetical protein